MAEAINQPPVAAQMIISHRAIEADMTGCSLGISSDGQP
jgi:hypothetical protein